MKILNFILSVSVLLSAAVAEGRPNIVFIMADDLGYGDISPYGNEDVETPHLDRLAEEGTRFSQFYANAPVCTPTRAAFLTGRYQQRAGVHGVFEGELQRGETLISHRLKEAGYATGIFGKWHVSGHARTEEAFTRYSGKVPTTWGFDQFVGIMSGMVDGISHYTETGIHDWWHDDKNTKEEGYTTHLIAEHATKFIRENSDEPFFCYVPLTDIHFPWMTPEDEPYYAEGVDNPHDAYPERKRGGQHHGTDRLQAVVHRMIHEVDKAVGEIVETVDELQLAETTLIVFTSDNGGYIDYMGVNEGEISDMGGLRGSKHQVYEGGIRVPMIARMPGTIPANQVRHDKAMTFDFYPTFLEMTGLSVESPEQPALDGHSLWPMLTEGDELPDRPLFWNDFHRWAMRENDWKVVITSSVAKPELYHLASDHGEERNVASDHPEVLSSMLKKMRAWSQEVGTFVDFPSHTLGESPAYEKGALLFRDRSYRAGEIPETLSDLAIHFASIEGGNFEVARGGKIVALTPQNSRNPWSQAEKLQQSGFSLDESIPPFRLWPDQAETVRAYQKEVAAGEVLSFSKVCLLLLGEQVTLKPFRPGPWKENRGEVLYNGITLPEMWPPRHSKPASIEPMPVPYLEHPPEVIPIDVGRQLFVDDFLIESSTLTRTYHQAEKFEGNPVFTPTTPVERDNWNVVYLGQGGVFYDPTEEHYKMFYTAGWRGPLAMATSPDLKNWTRPALTPEGTNHLLPKGAQWHGPNTATAGSDNAVWYDIHAEDPIERIKFLTCWMHVPFEQRPDGFNHTLQTSNGTEWTTPVPTGKASDYGSFFYNPFRNKWVQSIKKDGPRGRSRWYAEADDFLASADWSAAVYWTNADKLDQPEPEETYPGPPTQPQLYSLAAVGYESLMIGMHQIHRGPDNNICDEGNFPKLTDLELGFSRDGFHWHRPDRRGFIRGERTEGSWDRAYLHTTTGIFVIHDDQLVFPYCGYAGTDPNSPPDMYKGASIGLATLRRDGFASLDAYEQAGELTTRPVVFSGRELFVNLEAPTGELTVVVLDVRGETVAESHPVKGDSTASRVTWKERNSLNDFTGEPVRFRFELMEGSLYSFWMSPDQRGTSGGYLGAGFSGLQDVKNSEEKR